MYLPRAGSAKPSPSICPNARPRLGPRRVASHHHARTSSPPVLTARRSTPPRHPGALGHSSPSSWRSSMRALGAARVRSAHATTSRAASTPPTGSGSLGLGILNMSPSLLRQRRHSERGTRFPRARSPPDTMVRTGAPISPGISGAGPVLSVIGPGSWSRYSPAALVRGPLLPDAGGTLSGWLSGWLRRFGGAPSEQTGEEHDEHPDRHPAQRPKDPVALGGIVGGM